MNHLLERRLQKVKERGEGFRGMTSFTALTREAGAFRTPCASIASPGGRGKGGLERGDSQPGQHGANWRTRRRLAVERSEGFPGSECGGLGSERIARAPRAHSRACASLGVLRHPRRPRRQRLLAAWSTDCFHPRLGVGVMVGEKERPTRNQGLRKLRTSWSFLPFSNCLGACPSASLAVPGGGVHPLGPQGVPQGGVRHRGGQGAQRPPAAGVQAGFILAYGLRGGEGEPEVPAVSEGSAVRAGLSKYLCPPELPCPAAGSGRTKI